MISKTMLKIDITIQSVIIGGMLLCSIFTPSSFAFIGLVTFLFLGFWQFCSGLVAAVAFRNKIRQKYIIAAIVYVIGLCVLTVINDGFTAKIGNFFMESFVFIYFVGGCLAFASWYYYRTYQDLENGNYQHPRSFWDYEF